MSHAWGRKFVYCSAGPWKLQASLAQEFDATNFNAHNNRSKIYQRYRMNHDTPISIVAALNNEINAHQQKIMTQMFLASE